MGVTKTERKQNLSAKLSNRISDDNNNNNEEDEDIDGTSSCINNINEFYRDANIFITGATGFVGKALLEKLLRTCDLLNNVYVLLRPKRGMSIEQRFKELLKNPVSVT